MIARLINFLTKDLWRIRTKNLPLSKSLYIHPLRIIMLVWRRFNEAIVEAGKDRAFQPAHCVEHLTIKDVSDMLENKGTTNISVSETEELKKLRDALGNFSEIIKNSPANILLKDI